MTMVITILIRFKVNLTTRWHHLHCLGLPFWHYQLLLSLYLHQPEKLNQLKKWKWVMACDIWPVAMFSSAYLPSGHRWGRRPCHWHLLGYKKGCSRPQLVQNWSCPCPDPPSCTPSRGSCYTRHQSRTSCSPLIDSYFHILVLYLQVSWQISKLQICTGGKSATWALASAPSLAEAKRVAPGGCGVDVALIVNVPCWVTSPKK